MNTTHSPAQTPDTSNSFNTDDKDTVSVTPNIDNIQNNINTLDDQNFSNNTSRTETAVNSSAHPTTNNSVNANNAVKEDNSVNVNNAVNADSPANENNRTNVDNSIPKSSADQGVQSNTLNTENIEQDDFLPVSSVSPSTENNTLIENTVSDENESGECAVYSEENMSAISEIEHKLGYDIKIPHYIPDDYKTDSLSAPFDAFAEITYSTETDTLYYRTAKSSEDISGDYNNYSEIETVVINDIDVTIKGNDNLYHNASWFSDDEAFSIYSDNGIERDTIIDIVESVD